MKEVLTTGQVAKICNVTIRTVIKWFEAGKLEGYKIPASKDRRIPKENLLTFLQEHKIPYDPKLFELRPKLLVADDDKGLCDLIVELFEDDGDIEVLTAHNGYQAGFETMRQRPALLLIDFNLGDTTAWDVLETIGRDPSLSATKVIVMTGYYDDPGVQELIEAGLRVIQKPFDFAAMREEVREYIGLTPANS